MDPDATLAALRRLVRDADQLRADYEDFEGEGFDCDELADFIEEFAQFFRSLDGWLSKGGSKPHDWRSK